MVSQEVCVCLPVRYASSRLPGKPLLSIGGKPMILRTFEQALKSKYVDLSNLYLFTDDERIANVIFSSYKNAHVIMTNDRECPNALYRLSYYEEWLPEDCRAIINLHGDEPFLNPVMLDCLFESYFSILVQCPILIFYRPITGEDAKDRSIVKLMKNTKNDVMTFSRALIPHTKSGVPDSDASYYGVIGLHLIGRGSLVTYGKCTDDEIFGKGVKPLYLSEDIEELRLLEIGEKIKCLESPVLETERSLNTPEDYDYLVSKYGK